MANPNTVPAARVFGFVAAEADVCVLLRLGPQKWTLMVRWDLATDEFEIGQWLGTPIKSAALSPDGRLFAVHTNNFRRRESGDSGAYVAVSRPPYFSALALWWSNPLWRGGVRWSTNHGIIIDSSDGTRLAKGRVPPGFVTHQAAHESWDWSQDPALVAHSDRMQRAIEAPGGLLLHPQEVFVGVDWCDADHHGRFLFSRRGRVFVREGNGERELIDLNPFAFEPVTPPEWAAQWPKCGLFNSFQHER